MKKVMLSILSISFIFLTGNAIAADFFLQNNLSGLCLEVAGAPGVTAASNVQIAVCEWNGGPGGTHTDQIWRYDSRGFIVNTLSGFCLDVVGTPGTAHGSNVALAACEWSGYVNGTPTDQKWDIRSDGFIVNRLSGRCLEVSGAPGLNHGDNVQLATCEYSGYYNGTPTDQKWTKQAK